MIGGRIHINEHTIANWSATNLSGKMSHDKVNTYACHIEYEGNDGYPYTATFEVEHKYGDGPLVLAGKILTKCGPFLKRRPLSPEDYTRHLMASKVMG